MPVPFHSIVENISLSGMNNDHDFTACAIYSMPTMA